MPAALPPPTPTPPRLARALPAFALALAPWLAGAQALPGSTVMLDIEAHAVGAELRLPLADLEIAFTHDAADPIDNVAYLGATPFSGAPNRVLARFGPRIATYVLRHVHASGLDGQPWSVTLRDVALDTSASTPDAVVRLQLTPPAGAPPNRWRLDCDVITHALPAEELPIWLRSDWDNGVLASAPQLLGRIHRVVRSVTIAQPDGDASAGLRSALALGMTRLANRTDTLLFLLMLALSAPLQARRRAPWRWHGANPPLRTLRRLGGIGVAFAAGQALTLVAVALGGLRLPEAALGGLVAVSILVAAAHAWRPLFPRRERWIAAGFGLAHGAALGQVIAAQPLDTWHRVLATVGFAAGGVLMQLVLAAATLPFLLVAAGMRLYALTRLAAAAFAGVAAAGWIGERLFGIACPMDPVIDAAAAHTPVALLMLTIAAVAWRLLELSAPAAGLPGAEEFGRSRDELPRS